METNLLNMPGYRNEEYLLVLNPHLDLRNKIVNIKKELSGALDSPVAHGGKPNITLARFTTWQMMEEKLLNRLKVIAMGIPPFRVFLKDYGSMPSHTIFINITTKIPIYDLVKEVRSAKRLMKSPDHEPYFITEPFVTIARKLTHEQYKTAWADFSHRSFTASFIADGMLLLKRREGEKAYQIVQRLEFQNLPVTTKQGELFG